MDLGSSRNTDLSFYLNGASHISCRFQPVLWEDPIHQREQAFQLTHTGFTEQVVQTLECCYSGAEAPGSTGVSERCEIKTYHLQPWLPLATDTRHLDENRATEVTTGKLHLNNNRENILDCYCLKPNNAIRTRNTWSICYSLSHCLMHSMAASISSKTEAWGRYIHCSFIHFPFVQNKS